jgi:uncharacterized membrane protein YfbV (UPF0208 family)
VWSEWYFIRVIVANVKSYQVQSCLAVVQVSSWIKLSGSVRPSLVYAGLSLNLLKQHWSRHKTTRTNLFQHEITWFSMARLQNQVVHAGHHLNDIFQPGSA